MPGDRRTRIGLRTVALGYLALLLAFPVAFVFYRTFENGLGAVWDALTTPNAIHALELTLLMVAVAVPLNTAFGVLAALGGSSTPSSTCRSRSRRSSSAWRCSSSTAARAGSGRGSWTRESRSSSRPRA
jgi:ABC-type sugar transport system permease subunit